MRLEWRSYRTTEDVKDTGYCLITRTNSMGNMLVEYRREGQGLTFTLTELEELCRNFKKLLHNEEKDCK